jgi:hypothetical protein
VRRTQLVDTWTYAPAPTWATVMCPKKLAVGIGGISIGDVQETYYGKYPRRQDWGAKCRRVGKSTRSPTTSAELALLNSRLSSWTGRAVVDIIEIPARSLRFV